MPPALCTLNVSDSVASKAVAVHCTEQQYLGTRTQQSACTWQQQLQGALEHPCQRQQCLSTTAVRLSHASVAAGPCMCVHYVHTHQCVVTTCHLSHTRWPALHAARVPGHCQLAAASHQVTHLQGSYTMAPQGLLVMLIPGRPGGAHAQEQVCSAWSEPS